LEFRHPSAGTGSGKETLECCSVTAVHPGRGAPLSHADAAFDRLASYSSLEIFR
jgi:hypothetical protein